MGAAQDQRREDEQHLQRAFRLRLTHTHRADALECLSVTEGVEHLNEGRRKALGKARRQGGKTSTSLVLVESTADTISSSPTPSRIVVDDGAGLRHRCRRRRPRRAPPIREAQRTP